MFEQAIWLGAAIIAITPMRAHSTERAYTIEPARTVVTFEVSHLGIAKRRGVFEGVSGTVVLDNQAGNGSLHIIVDARSVRASDPATQTFVRGKSFLNVDHYSEIAYQAERVVFQGGKPSRIDGELTLLGVTRTVSLTVSDYQCGDECTLDAAATFRRSEFGMNHYLTFVSDDVTLTIHGVTKGVD
jgi:polyisoprenoid-binding protein YceI